MQKRRVTTPDGRKWIVGRRWLLGRPRYFGFRFGVDKTEKGFEPPLKADEIVRVRRRPDPTQEPTPPPVVYSDRTPRSSTTWIPTRTRSGGGGGWFNWGGSGGSGSSGGGSRGGSSGGGSRGGSKGGGKRGGGGGAIGGLLAALAKALKWILIAALIVAITLFVIFVLVPGLIFLLHYVAFYVVVGVTILIRVLTGRPWIVEVEEFNGYHLEAWRVKGWDASKTAIDEIAESLRRGETPNPTAAEPANIINA